MLNLRQELENYPTIDLDNILKASPDISDSVKNSIILYNKALESLKIDSEDIAIIELKKAVAMNPNFHEAMNLLGLCYSYTKEYSKAIDIFEKVMAAENNSVQAMRYLSLLNTGTGQTIAVDGKLKAGKKNTPNKPKEKDAAFSERLKKININWTSNFPRYLIGFTAGALVVLLVSLVVGAFSNKATGKSSDVLGDKTAGISQESDYKSEYDELNNKYTALQEEMSKVSTEVDYYRNAAKLLEVDDMVDKKSLEAAADMLVLLKGAGFKDGEKEKYDSLCASVMPKASSTLLTEGIKLMNKKQYQEALNKLNKILIYLNDWAYMDRTLYNIGKCYMSIQDSKNAIATFNQIKEKYPNTKYANYADAWIKSLTQNP